MRGKKSRLPPKSTIESEDSQHKGEVGRKEDAVQRGGKDGDVRNGFLLKKKGGTPILQAPCSDTGVSRPLSGKKKSAGLSTEE